MLASATSMRTRGLAAKGGKGGGQRWSIRRGRKPWVRNRNGRDLRNSANGSPHARQDCGVNRLRHTTGTHRGDWPIDRRKRSHGSRKEEQQQHGKNDNQKCTCAEHSTQYSVWRSALSVSIGALRHDFTGLGRQTGPNLPSLHGFQALSASRPQCSRRGRSQNAAESRTFHVAGSTARSSVSQAVAHVG